MRRIAERRSKACQVDALAELETQWAAIESGAIPTVPHEKVARWLETWGTPAFKPWRDQ
jgi:hypothetical protein